MLCQTRRKAMKETQRDDTAAASESADRIGGRNRQTESADGIGGWNQWTNQQTGTADGIGGRKQQLTILEFTMPKLAIPKFTIPNFTWVKFVQRYIKRNET